MRKDWMVRIFTFFLGALPATSAVSQTAERIVMDGSTGVMPLAAALAKAFQERHPGVTIEMGKGLGTKARVQALADGRSHCVGQSRFERKRNHPRGNGRIRNRKGARRVRR